MRKSEFNIIRNEMCTIEFQYKRCINKNYKKIQTKQRKKTVLLIPYIRNDYFEFLKMKLDLVLNAKLFKFH